MSMAYDRYGCQKGKESDWHHKRIEILHIPYESMMHYRAYVVLNYKEADGVAYDIEYGVVAFALVLILVVLRDTFIIVLIFRVEDALVAQLDIMSRKQKYIHILVLL